MISGVPLIIGAWVALRFKPSSRIVGMIMGFGAGALIGALGATNTSSATMNCNMLEDEKVWNMIHFAIGMNLDNDGHAFIHQDRLVKRPSLWVDRKLIMKDGDILISSISSSDWS